MSVRDRVRSSLDRMKEVAALSAGASLLACSGSTPPIDPGYGVVDPMPSPARCDEPFAGRIWPSATWHQQDGRFVLHIDIDLQWAIDPSGAISATPEVAGGKLLAMPQTPARKLSIDVVPDAGAPELLVTFPLTCPPASSRAKFRFDLKGPLADGQGANAELVPEGP
jgi:hypothetical protein